MRLKGREKALLALLAVASAAALVHWLRGPATPRLPLARSGRTAAVAQAEPIKRIDLDRLQHSRSDAAVGRRDIFGFATPQVAEATPAPAPADTAGRPTPAAPVTPAAAAGPRLPALNVKYVGSVDNGRGVRVVVLLTDRNEVLTGQAGDVVANRYRIAKIGFESVDLEDVGSGQLRRIPLRGQ